MSKILKILKVKEPDGDNKKYRTPINEPMISEVLRSGGGKGKFGVLRVWST